MTWPDCLVMSEIRPEPTPPSQSGDVPCLGINGRSRDEGPAGRRARHRSGPIRSSRPTTRGFREGRGASQGRLAIDLLGPDPAAWHIVPVKIYAGATVRESDLETAAVGCGLVLDQADGHGAMIGGGAQATWRRLVRRSSKSEGGSCNPPSCCVDRRITLIGSRVARTDGLQSALRVV
jgi:hypothetical protein